MKLIKGVKHYRRRCRRCGKLYWTSCKSGKVCDKCSRGIGGDYKRKGGRHKTIKED